MIQQIESASPEQLTEMIKDAGADLDSWLADRTGEDFMAVTDRSIDHVEVASR